MKKLSIISSAVFAVCTLALSFFACTNEDLLVVDKNVNIVAQAGIKQYRVSYNDTIPFSIKFNRDVNNRAKGYIPVIKIKSVGANGKVFYYDKDSVKHEYFTNFNFEMPELDTLGGFDFNFAVTSISKSASKIDLISEVVFGDRVARDTMVININNSEKFVIDARIPRDTMKVGESLPIKLFFNNTEGDNHTYTLAAIKEDVKKTGVFDISFPQKCTNNTWHEFSYSPTVDGQHVLYFVVVDDQTSQQVQTKVVINVTDTDMVMELIGENSGEVKTEGGFVAKSINIADSKKMYLYWEKVHGDADIDVNGKRLAEKEQMVFEKGKFNVALKITPKELFESEYKFVLMDELGRQKSLNVYVYRYAIIKVGEIYKSTTINKTYEPTFYGAYKRGEICNLEVGTFNKNEYSYKWLDSKKNQTSSTITVTKDDSYFTEFTTKQYSVKLCNRDYPDLSQIFVKKPNETEFKKATSTDLGKWDYGTRIQISTTALEKFCTPTPVGEHCMYLYWRLSGVDDSPVTTSRDYTIIVSEKIDGYCYYYSE